MRSCSEGSVVRVWAGICRQCLSSSKKGRSLGRNRLSVVKIAGSSGSAIDGPDSRIGPWVPPDL
ncbi:hypothetical protein F2Q68_00021809 [Brassica cretica]|uniref:Uncharacterized protein n=1 Tax=Brassica cretica TaxID=69181 RepID=A0A8S9FUK7_BRACR|nr:hypothetical protein F2Q68_00021809 [Brassica cretica]